jgi:hypothetical protein
MFRKVLQRRSPGEWEGGRESTGGADTSTEEGGEGGPGGMFAGARINHEGGYTEARINHEGGYAYGLIQRMVREDRG